MTQLTLGFLLYAGSLGAGSELTTGLDYATAYKMTNETGRPLVVLIGADWCPGCQTMKNSSMPELARKGGLNDVAYAYVNSDRERKLATKLMKGNSIPQLIVFNKTDSGWKRQHVTGAHSATAIKTFLDQAAPVRSVERLSKVE